MGSIGFFLTTATDRRKLTTYCGGWRKKEIKQFIEFIISQKRKINKGKFCRLIRLRMQIDWRTNNCLHFFLLFRAHAQEPITLSGSKLVVKSTNSDQFIRVDSCTITNHVPFGCSSTILKKKRKKYKIKSRKIEVKENSNFLIWIHCHVDENTWLVTLEK